MECTRQLLALLQIRYISLAPGVSNIEAGADGDFTEGYNVTNTAPGMQFNLFMDGKRMVFSRVLMKCQNPLSKQPEQVLVILSSKIWITMILLTSETKHFWAALFLSLLIRLTLEQTIKILA